MSNESDAAVMVRIIMQEAAQKSGTLIRSIDRTHLHVGTKKGDPRNIVTLADTTSEQCITSILQALPEFGFAGEEGAERPGTKGIFYIDPLDGTIPFSAGLETYSVSIGLVQNGTPTHGVIFYPANSCMLYAESGEFVSRKISPVEPKLIHNLVVGFDYSLGMDRELQVRDYYLPLVKATRYVLTFACVTWACRLIMEGKLDAYVHPGATPYDWAAAACILQEAGAVVCNFDGKPLDFSQKRVPAIAARNQEIMDTILNIYKH
ncbi:MAG: inositol monophosphatase [Patescibacteria group bacterium]